MGRAQFRSLSDFTKHGANLACRCSGCRHRGVVDRYRLSRWFFLHRLNGAIELLPSHLRCHVCGARPRHISAAWERPTLPEWMADERAWQRLARRLRG